MDIIFNSKKMLYIPNILFISIVALLCSSCFNSSRTNNENVVLTTSAHINSINFSVSNSAATFDGVSSAVLLAFCNNNKLDNPSLWKSFDNFYSRPNFPTIISNGISFHPLMSASASQLKYTTKKVQGSANEVFIIFAGNEERIFIYWL